MTNKNKLFSHIDGILLLNKPKDISSNRALQQAKYLFQAKKAGHTGSLDPMATGMLPVCFGQATKISGYLLDADKCYKAEGLLGVKTDTADATGKVIQTVNDFNVKQESLLSVMNEFKGINKQTPSMYSALKHCGVPLYKYARKGITIDRKARDIHIKELSLLSFDGSFFSFLVTCSKGTYIRNLVEDIGDVLQVGAHVTRLDRCYTSGFENQRMYSLEELALLSHEERIQTLIPMDAGIDFLPKLILTEEEVLSISQGKLLFNRGDMFSFDKLGDNENIRLYNECNKFIGIGTYTIQGMLKAKRLLNLDKIFLN